MTNPPSSNTGKNLRWGIIGCGNVTEVKSGPAYKKTQGFSLDVVMRRDKEKARDYAKRHGIPRWTTKATEIINDPDIDAIYIATPPDTHKFYGLQVAEAGKPCCIEKPMAPSYTDSLEIYNAFQEKGIPLFIAYYRRSLPRFLKIKEWLDNGLIGEVRHIHWLKTRTLGPLDTGQQYQWRTDAKIAPAGYFDDLASHGLNLFTFLLGPIANATGVAINQLGRYSALDTVSGSWIHENGVTGTGSWNFGSFRPLDEVKIIGGEGEIHFSVLGEAPIQLITSDHSETLYIEHPQHLHQFHVENMAKRLFFGTPHPSMGDTGLHTSWVMDKILGRLP